MDSIYRTIQEFLAKEIEILGGPLEFDQRLVDELCRHAQPSVVKKALRKINYRRKVFSERIFTEQTQRHCIIEIQDNVKSRVVRAREDLAAQEQRLVAPEVVDAAKRQYRVDTLTDEELEELAENIIEAAGDLPELSVAKSLESFKVSKTKLAQYEYALTMMRDQLNLDVIHENHISLNPDLSDDLQTLKGLAQELHSEIMKNPHKFREFLRLEQSSLATRDQAFILTGQLRDFT